MAAIQIHATTMIRKRIQKENIFCNIYEYNATIILVKHFFVNRFDTAFIQSFKINLKFKLVLNNDKDKLLVCDNSEYF